MTTLLDTKVLSELRRAEPSPAVLAWFAAQPAASLFVSAVTQAEMTSARCSEAVAREQGSTTPATMRLGMKQYDACWPTAA